MRWIWDYFRYAWYDLQDMRHVQKVYYQDPTFGSIDRSLLKKYIFRSPYRISKQYLKCKQEEDLYTYGETPLSTFEKIAEELEINALDRVLELGSGRGRGVFFLAHFYNCEVIGIERVPQFVKLASYVAHEHQIRNVAFKCADMFKVDWPKVNIVYLYGTCLKEDEIEHVIENLKTFPKGTQVLSVSYPLIDYDQAQTFKLKKAFTVSFPWGETEAFLQIVQ